MGTKKSLLYCDPCGKGNNLPIDPDKVVKGTCQLCNKFMGPLNEVMEEDYVSNDISQEVLKVGTFEIQQMPNFLVGMNPKDIHPNLPYKIISQDLVFYFPSLSDDPLKRKTFITVNPIQGTQFKTTMVNRRNSDENSLDT
jgi:hypothetical protein